MLIISHRGNLEGPLPGCENSLPYIQVALDAGFFVEVDLWFTDSSFWLGHDSPQYMVSYTFLKSYSHLLWIHCKNLGALYNLLNDGCFNFFYHENDGYTLTSMKYIWAHPNVSNFSGAIHVMPEKTHNGIFPNLIGVDVVGICTDFPILYKRVL